MTIVTDRPLSTTAWMKKAIAETNGDLAAALGFLKAANTVNSVAGLRCLSAKARSFAQATGSLATHVTMFADATVKMGA